MSLQKIPPNLEPKTALFLAYVTTMTLPRAIRMITMQQEHAAVGLDAFASAVIDAMPLNFFELPLQIPQGPRFVIYEGDLTMRFDIDPNQPQITPEDLHPFLIRVNPLALPTEPPRRRNRTLNSFMACRTFLAPLFPHICQKDKSRLISTIWTIDPFKPQWAVLAKAYTLLREHFDLDDTRVSNFVAKTKHLFNFPTPQQYLDRVGWRIQRETVAHFTLTHSVPRITFQLPLQAVSDEDVIRFCETIAGYTRQKLESLWPFRNEFTYTMAINHRGIMPDPLLWLIDADGNLVDINEGGFTAEEIFDVPDSSVDPRNLMYNPDERAQQAARREEQMLTELVLRPAHNQRLEWSSWAESFPLTLPRNTDEA